MRKLKVYDQSSFDFHKEVIASKKNTKDDPSYKTRVTLLNENINSQFIRYDSLFESNDLQSITNLMLSIQNIDDLKKLYSYELDPIKKIKIKVTTSEVGRIINTCQNCTINQIDSFDHLIPQGEFSEFSVNPKNLFPSCTDCNRRKNSVWRANGKRKFLNLYLDELPNVQYLFVDIVFENDVPVALFKVENPYGIDVEMFELIKSHYDKLELCNRFSSAIEDTVVLTIIAINEGLESIPIEEFRKTNTNSQDKVKIAFGFNYWKAILQTALVDSDLFIEYAQKLNQP
jgi:5-methylcytosine-specific restriction endonuclease McrA